MEFMDLSKPEYSYMFGFLQTDGTLSQGKGLKGRVSVEIQRRDEPILHEFRRLTPYNSRVSRRTRTTNFKVGYESSVWTMCSLEGRLKLIELGFIVGRKSGLVAPPRAEHSSPHYVRGLIDGDGSVGTTAKGYPFVSFVTESAFLLDYVSDFVFEAVGCRHRVKRNARDGVFNIVFVNEPAVELARVLYGGGIALERKQSAAESISAWTRPAGMRRRSETRRWTPEQDAVVLASSVADAAQILGRTEQSCSMRRWRLTKPVAVG
ncbi:hypothetical protein ABH926_002269 [Catenulispora sp. GP43]|uniref:LAGLIDADG family homing endonuclease n=1 Tax=Catenulispora sp. GP43 TaxID=3156263 RepID=UPI00351773C3